MLWVTSKSLWLCVSPTKNTSWESHFRESSLRGTECFLSFLGTHIKVPNIDYQCVTSLSPKSGEDRRCRLLCRSHLSASFSAAGSISAFLWQSPHLLTLHLVDALNLLLREEGESKMCKSKNNTIYRIMCGLPRKCMELFWWLKENTRLRRKVTSSN